ncbi:hypothetical protein [Flavobacterium sp.]|jgi:hypothetical protein|uniref:hypothetical protein n=1 Tax=Flavobacterium sp. TaxID=239 RepID=UPI0037BF6284
MKKLLITNWHLMRWIRFFFMYFDSKTFNYDNKLFLSLHFFFYIQVPYDTNCVSIECSKSLTDTTNEK